MNFSNIVILLFLLTVGIAACDSARSEATPAIQITGELTSDTSTPRPTQTGTPTPLPSRTPISTARQVTVSRVDPDINPAQVTPIAPGAQLPDLTLTDINGNELNLRDVNRPLVLNFWSVGCGSCFFEFPLLQEFSEKHGEDNLLVIGINIADFPEETRTIGEQLGITFPLVVDVDAELFTTYFNGAVVPTTIFIDGDGRVAQVAIGPLDEYNLDLQLQNIGLPSEIDTAR